MSVTRFNEKLNALLSKKSIEKNDFLGFMKTVSALSKGIQDKKKLSVYGPVVKEWIGAFQKIFGKHKIDKEMRRYMNRLSTTMTKLYLKISQIFHQYERDYTQQFYWQWKQMISVLITSKRASSFIKNMNQFKHTVTHLRTAQLRCEQLAILKVLNLYIEQVPPSGLKKFKKQVTADDMDIVDGLIQLRQPPSSIHVNAFLHHINSMGDSISSFQPTKITCANLALEYIKPEFEMWIDFNLKDKSIMFVAEPSTNDANQCVAIVPDPKLKECVINGEQLIIIKGSWSICTVPEINQSGQKLNVTIFVPAHVRNMILGSQVRSVFKIKSKTNSSCGETSSIDSHSEQKNSKWRNYQNALLPPPSYDQRTSEEPSLRSHLARSIESSIVLLSSDQSVMEWKKSSCERLSSDGQQNRELLVQGTDLEDELICDDLKNECIKDTAAKMKMEKDPPVKRQALGGDLHRLHMSFCDMSVQETDMDDKFDKLIMKDRFAGGLVSDVKAENIDDTVTKKKTVEKHEKSSTNLRRNEDDQITKGPLVIPFALDDDYQSSGVSFGDNISHKEYTDDDIDNVHNKSVSGKDYFASVNICSVPQNPLIEEIAPLRSRNENIKVWDMPKALQQLGIDYDSSESFCDNESVKETYDSFENSIKNSHLTDNKQILTSTPRRNYDTNVKTSGASSFIEPKETNLKLAENSLNANKLPKIDNTQYIQPSLTAASDNWSIVDQNHFVPSNLVESHDRNKNGSADSTLILPPPINETVAINASEPRKTFSNRNVNETEMIQNTSGRIYDTNIKTSGTSSFNERKESNLKLAKDSLKVNQLPKIDNTQYFQPLLSVASDNLSIVDQNHFVPSILVESNDRNKNGSADSTLILPPPINQTVAINASEPRKIFCNRNVNETEMIQNTSGRIYDTNIKTSGTSSFNERKESNLKLAEDSLKANQLPKIDNTQYFQPLLSVASDNLSIVDENHIVPLNLVLSHDRNKNGNADSSVISPPLIYQTVAINARKPREKFSNRNVSEMVQNTVTNIANKTVEYEFANDEELQRASRFYIDNNGLDYLNSTNFKRLNRSQQKTREQQLRTIHDMMNRGLEALHLNRNDEESHGTDLYDFVQPDRPISKRKSNSKKVASQNFKKTATKKFPFEFPKRKLGKSDEPNKGMTSRRRIRNISLLFEDKTAPKLKTSKNVDKIMTAPMSEVNRSKNKRTKASTTQTFTMNNELPDSTTVGKENARSSLPNYRAKKPKIEILSVVDLGVLHQSSEIMNQRDDQQVFCNVQSCNALFNDLNKFTLHTGACKQHEHQLMQFTKGLQSIYQRVDAVNTHAADV